MALLVVLFAAAGYLETRRVTWRRGGLPGDAAGYLETRWVTWRRGGLPGDAAGYLETRRFHYIHARVVFVSPIVGR